MRFLDVFSNKLDRERPIFTVQVRCCKEDLEAVGREGKVTCSLTMLAPASHCMKRYCTHYTL